MLNSCANNYLAGIRDGGFFDNVLESFNKILDVCTLSDVVAAEIHENDVRTVVLHFVELVLKFPLVDIPDAPKNRQLETSLLPL